MSDAAHMFVEEPLAMSQEVDDIEAEWVTVSD